MNASSTNEKFRLKKRIGIWSAVSILCGTIVGSGIFISPVGVLANMHGSVGMSLAMWIACSIIAGCSALCYAELGCCIRESGGDFAYNNVAIGPCLAFVYAWTVTLLVKGMSLASTSTIFAIYLLKLFYPYCDSPQISIKLIAAATIVLITWINSTSVIVTTKLEIVFASAKFAVLLLITCTGFFKLCQGNEVALYNFENAFQTEVLETVGVGDVGLALFQGLFSYSGYINLNFLVEEMKNAGTDLPRAIKISFFIVTVFYLMINVSYFSGKFILSSEGCRIFIIFVCR